MVGSFKDALKIYQFKSLRFLRGLTHMASLTYNHPTVALPLILCLPACVHSELNLIRDDWLWATDGERLLGAPLFTINSIF